MTFWIDEKPRTTCCLFATDEEIETEPEAYDCLNCSVAEALDGLDKENREAWVLYRKVMTRFAVEVGTVPLIFDRLTAGMDPEDFGDLVTRCALIFDELNPIPVAATD